MEEGAYSATKELFVTVTTELAGERSGFVSERQEGCVDVVVLQRLKAKRPVVTSCAVDEDECELKTSDGYAIAKGNVDVDDVEVLRGEAIDGFTARRFGNRCVGPKGKGKFAGVEKSTVFRSRNDVLVITEAAAPGESVEFLRGVRRFGLRRIGCVAWTNRRQAGVGVMERRDNLFFGHAFQFGWRRRLVVRGARGSRCLFICEKASNELVAVEIRKTDRVLA